MGFYDRSGHWIDNVTVGLSRNGHSLSPTVSIEVDAAVERAKNGASALEEMAKLFQAHPLLKSEDRWSFPENPHPLSALIGEYVRQIYE
jgi:hypothetical protein